jgi:hypothetical protein
MATTTNTESILYVSRRDDSVADLLLVRYSHATTNNLINFVVTLETKQCIYYNIQYSYYRKTVILWTGRPSTRTLCCWATTLAQQFTLLRLKKLLIHPFISPRSSFYRSYLLACRLRAHGHWPCQALRAAASEAQCSAADLARHGARPPPSRGARLSSLPGAARGCPLQVARPQPPAAHAADAFLPQHAATAAYKRRGAGASSEHHVPTSLHFA